MIIRQYRSSDRDALYDICVRTAYNGGDSRDIYPDLELMPSIFAAPYAHLEPELTFVVDDGERAVGYILGTADTAGFVKAFRDQWLPLLTRYPKLSAPPVTPSDHMLALMHDPERMLVPEVADYPAHLHIDLLPDHQRGGWGRRLMTAFCDALAARGVPAVHLGMVTSNTAARAFYDRVGFHEIAVIDPITYLGRTIERPLK